jgi:hypothetical protein
VLTASRSRTWPRATCCRAQPRRLTCSFHASSSRAWASIAARAGAQRAPAPSVRVPEPRRKRRQRAVASTEWGRATRLGGEARRGAETDRERPCPNAPEPLRCPRSLRPVYQAPPAFQFSLAARFVRPAFAGRRVGGLPYSVWGASR